VTLSVYDAAGRRVARLLDGNEPEGEHSVVWDGRDEALRDVPSGVYFARLAAEGRTSVRKLVCLR
jgi:flagellar hook assembly protein FlgD